MPGTLCGRFVSLNTSFKRNKMNAKFRQRRTPPANRLTCLPEKHENVIVDLDDSEILKILKERQPSEILKLLKNKNLGKVNLLTKGLICSNAKLLLRT